eukprot:9484850-Pyramimonas_sp.AAC.1
MPYEKLAQCVTINVSSAKVDKGKKPQLALDTDKQSKDNCRFPFVGTVTTTRVNPCTQIGQLKVEKKSEHVEIQIPLYLSGSGYNDPLSHKMCVAWSMPPHQSSEDSRRVLRVAELAQAVATSR